MGRQVYRYFSAWRSGLTVTLMAVMLVGCFSMGRSNDEAQRAAELEAFYRKWSHVSYQYGGSGQGGMDCSALTQQAYRDLYGLRLPRTTEDQAKVGKRVSKRRLRAGDLVFFKTGWSTRHVGVYIGDGMFVHSSASSGVVKSSLATEYWKDRYWRSRRILD